MKQIALVLFLLASGCSPDSPSLPISKRIEGMTAILTDGTMYKLDATLTNWVEIGKSNALKTLP